MQNKYVAEKMTTPWFAPGGKAIEFHCALRVWLTRRKAKSGRVMGDHGLQIGSEVKARIQKVRSPGYGRECVFNIMWGGDSVRIADEESWLEVLPSLKSDRYRSSGAWKTIIDGNGKEHKFQSKDWIEKLKNKDFKDAVLSILREELIDKYKE